MVDKTGSWRDFPHGDLFKVIVATMLVQIVSLPLHQQAAKAAGSAPPAKSEHAKNEEHQPKMIERPVSYAVLPDDENQPWRIVRRLQQLQDQFLLGDESKLEEYRYSINHASTLMREVSPDAWRYQRNLDAAAMFLLFGGNDAVGKQALLQTPRRKSVDTIPLRIAIAYRDRNYQLAGKFLTQLDDNDLPPSIRGQFAFIASVVLGRSSLEISEQYLQKARLQAAGTLIEETALRRLVAIAGEKGDVDALRRFTRQYMERFSRSVYYPDFVRNFSGAALKLSLDTFEQVEDKFVDAVDLVPAQRRPELLAAIASRAISQGRLKLADWASSSGLALKYGTNSARNRMKLYLAASRMLQLKTYPDAMVLAGQVDRLLLDPDHLRFLNAIEQFGAILDSNPDLPLKASAQSEAVPGSGGTEAAMANLAEHKEDGIGAAGSAENETASASKAELEGMPDMLGKTMLAKNRIFEKFDKVMKVATQ